MAVVRCEATKLGGLTKDEIPVGRAADGTLVRIDLAKAPGLACELNCPACGGPLIAYLRTTKKRQHFGHHSRSKCRYAYETALHLYAKQLIEQRNELTLPPVVAGSGKILRKESQTRFDSVLLEKRFHEIVPDITAIKRDRRLLVEIAVTHFCEARKLKVLAQRQLAAVEIDLSGYRFSLDPELLDDAILSSAPRKWVFHPAIESENQAEATRRLAAAAARTAAEQKKALKEAERLSKLVTQWMREDLARRNDPATGIPFLDDLQMCGIDDLVGIDLPGQWVMASSPNRWQSELLWHLMKNDKFWARGVHGATVASVLERMHYKRSELHGMDGSVRAALLRMHPDLSDIVEVSHAYVNWLRDSQFLDDAGRLAADIVAGALARRQAALDAKRAAATAQREREEQAARDLLQEQQRRREEDRQAAARAQVDDVISKLLAFLPEADANGFDREAWWMTSGKDGRTPMKRVADERFANTLANEITALAQLQATGGAPAPDLLNLPMHAMRERRDRERAERAAQEQSELAEQRLAAIEALGAPENWLETPHPELENLSPRLASLKSYELFMKARTMLLGTGIDRQSQWGLESPARPSSEHYRARLSAAAEHFYGSRAMYWMDSTSSTLGATPRSVCGDARSLERCLVQLEKDFRKKLPARFRTG